MDYNEISKKIKKVVHDKEDYAFIDSLELIRDFKNDEHFLEYVHTLLIIIEESSAFENAGTLLWKHIYRYHTSRGNKTNDAYSNFIFDFIKDHAPAPYINLTSLISRLITTIIYDTHQNQSRHITELTSKQFLIHINEFFLARFVKQNDLKEETISLLYHCIENIDINTRRIRLSPSACTIVREQIIQGGGESYLRFFLRPYFSAMSSYWLPDAMYHVPEPFYEQIFVNAERFRGFLEQQMNLFPNNELFKEISKFMNIFWSNRQRGIEYVDITQLKLHKPLHLHMRELK